MEGFKYKLYTFLVRSGSNVGTSAFTEEERLELIDLLTEAPEPPQHILESLDKRPRQRTTNTELYFYYNYGIK